MATASMAGLLPGWIPVHVPYSAAKMGIIGMMLNLALEMKAYGVRTTIYCPGGVHTAMKANNASYRPAALRGAGKRRGALPEASFKNNPLAFYSPESIAPDRAARGSEQSSLRVRSRRTAPLLPRDLFRRRRGLL